MTNPERSTKNTTENIPGVYTQISITEVEQWREFLQKDEASQMINIGAITELPHLIYNALLYYQKDPRKQLGEINAEICLKPNVIPPEAQSSWQKYTLNALRSSAVIDGFKVLTLAYKENAFYIPIHEESVIRVEVSGETNSCIVTIAQEDSTDFIEAFTGIYPSIKQPVDSYDSFRRCLTMWSHAFDVCIKNYGYGMEGNRIPFVLPAPVEHTLDVRPVPIAIPAQHESQERESSFNETDFEDIVGYDDVKEQLQSLADLYDYPDAARSIGLTQNNGILLYGPSDTGKTELVKALANQMAAPLVSPSLSSIFGKFSGDTRRNIDAFFTDLLTQQNKLVLFIDNFEEIGAANCGPERNDGVSRLAYWTDIICKDHHNILLVGATTQRNKIDSSLLSPRRFKPVEVTLPDEKLRTRIWESKLGAVALHAITYVDEGLNPSTNGSTLELQPGIDYASLAKASEGMAGGHIEAVVSDIRRRRLSDFVKTEKLPLITETEVLELLKSYTIDEQ